MKKSKRPVSAQALKKRRILFSRIRTVLLLLVICGSVAGLLSLQKNSTKELTVSKTEYHQLKKSDISADNNTTNVEEPVSAEEKAPVSTGLSDKAISAMARINEPRLKTSYPIEGVINSEYAIVYDVTADEVLFAKNPEVKCYPASTTKILTAAMVSEYAADDTEFTAGDELDMVSEGSSLAFLNKGSVLDKEMMLDALMLPSGNDAAYTAAATIGKLILNDENVSPKKSVDAFIDQMNLRLKGIGAENTRFTAPDGFHDDNHYTTALDMLKISLYAMQFDDVMKSADKPSRYVTFLSGEAVYWENSNKLIHEYSDCYYMYANGLKTGMTDEAGYCVVATARRFDHDVVCVVMNGPASDKRWNDTLWLLDRAFSCIRENN